MTHGNGTRVIIILPWEVLFIFEEYLAYMAFYNV